MSERVYTSLFPFGGIGAGARGFLDARITLFGATARFRCLGGIDLDPAACADFEYLADASSLCADVAGLTIERLRAFAGDTAPDVVFLSPPCKGASGLLSEARARSERYQNMNALALTWIRLMLAAWPAPPRLVLLENVPRLKTRAGDMLRELRRLLRAAGYVIADGYHDCGELGGLAQRRRRYLLVARHARSVPPLLYQPPRRRVRACGEVLAELPMPGDPAGGPMHVLPGIAWLNWIRLALVPAGGDWRNLPAILDEHRCATAARDVAPTLVGLGPNPGRHWNKYSVTPWVEPASTVTGASRPGSGAPAIADPRVTRAFDHGYAVLPWSEPSPTVAGGSYPGQGAYAVADVRIDCAARKGAYGVIPWTEAVKTVTGAAAIDNGSWAIADPRVPGAPPVMVIRDVRKAPPSAPIIVADDGTWHRPLSTLELAALQGLPTTWRGAPLKLAGGSASAWRERIGNAVPPPAAQAIAERMLTALLQADIEAFGLAGDADVWVAPDAPAEVAA